MEALLIPDGYSDSKPGCLKDYLNTDRGKTKRLLPGELAINDSKVFEKNIFNITDRLDKFLSSEEREIALLVLGKIQSGKTANLLGAIAWAADSKVSISVIFTGVTEALNLQTEKRIKKDLLQLNGQYVKIFKVPTSAKGKIFEELRQEIIKWVERRSHNVDIGLNKPLPVLVTLKNPSRVKTLKTLISQLEEKFGTKMVTLLIDDEADQASQNAKAQKREVTATYSAIRDLRDSKSRNILLSYTATPQAVLLTERNGRLRPNYCVTVEPRSGYFGLAHAVSDDFSNNRVEVIDRKKKSTKMIETPSSLRHALVRFSMTAWLRFYKESLFYGGSGLKEELLNSQLKSIQMLVHESGSQKKHKAVFRFVNDELLSLTESLSKAVTGQSTNSELVSLFELWQDDFREIKKGLSYLYQEELNIDIDEIFLKQILDLFDNTAIQVVNSDPGRPGRQGSIPVEDEEWEEFKLWILIGGDILGRGLTIPQLTTTYFLRHPPKPNFDTVSQQMRFCGYRLNYRHFTYLYAKEKTFLVFKIMNQIDSAIWRLAKKWDKEHLNIIKNMPIVMYASKPDVKLDPCRKTVRDPDLIDKKIKGEVIISNRAVMNPIHVKQNLQVLRNFIKEANLAGISQGDWYLYPEPSDVNMQRILSSWESSNTERNLLVGAAELFVPELEELGLHEIPRNILVHKDLIDFKELNIEWLLKRNAPSRKVSNLNANATIKSWKAAYEASFPGKFARISWPRLIVGHVGDGQRAIRSSFSPDATTLMIEPILGHLVKGQSPVSAGVAFTLFTPAEYEIRMIGLGSRLDSLGEL